MHPRNRLNGSYDFDQLLADSPDLKSHIISNKAGRDSIDFSDPQSVKALNKALLKSCYDVVDWDIPQDYLCPPIPGRADYIHHIADLLGKLNYGKIPYTNKTKCIDIGVGAGCVYPIIGSNEYGWSFVASDIDPVSIQSCSDILGKNEQLKRNISLKLQENRGRFFKGILKPNEKAHLSICNPPFHSSEEEAIKNNLRKTRNLKGAKVKTAHLNFGGNTNELWCEGGEKKFVRDMIAESKEFGQQVYLFSSIISKEAHLKSIYQALHAADVADFFTIPMGQGNKLSRIVAWTFLSKEERKKWKAK